MAVLDNVNSGTAWIQYWMGTAIARILLGRVGRQSRIHVSTKYWSPSRIWIGDGCEIRDGTVLDARSRRRVAIRLGDGTRIKDHVGLAAYGGEITLGRNVLIGRCSTVFGHGGVYIGDNSMLSPNVVITSSNYVTLMGKGPFQAQGFTRQPVRIEDNVWIGANACILGGSSIRSNVVVGAGAVVDGDLESGWLYGGIPARGIKPLDKQYIETGAVYHRNWGLFR